MVKIGKRRFVSKSNKTKKALIIYAIVELKQSQMYRIHIPNFKSE